MADEFNIDALGLYAEEAIEAGLVTDQAVRLVYQVSTPEDFLTEVFKSDCAATSIPEIELEVCDSFCALWKLHSD